MSVVAGQTIGNYTILQQIGTGGMGAVYLAEHPLIGKKVALKVIHKELAHNREVVGRFFNEARSVNRIGNEHIVEIHDFGQSPDGHHFFIMEYLEGRTLAQVLAVEKFMSVQRTLHVAAQIADALGAAHTAGIIHRDLKPDNIMLVTRLGDPDFVKILDFGLAKMFADGMASNLTAQGVVLGTPQYMSPEACESKRDIDHRTDIYAVGVLIFQMLCGQVPFDGQSMGEVLVKQVMHAPPAPRAINPQIPPSVEQIILRCLAKSPDARFPTMVALRDALFDPDRYLASSPPVMPAALTQASPAARTLFMEDGGPVPSQPMHGPNAALGYAATAAIQTGRSTGPAMALPAPPPSILSSAHQAEARTMFDAGGAPVAQPRPGGNDRTAIVDGASAGAAVMQARRTAGMQIPTQPLNNTMMIGTPAGYSDRPPRKAWPIVLLLVLVAAAVGGGIALAMMLGRDDAAPAAESAATPAADDVDAAPAAPIAEQRPAPAPAAIDAAPASVTAVDGGAVATAVVDAGAAAVAPPDGAAAAISPILVTIRIESQPTGADVWVDGKQLGKTPADVSIAPDGADHEIILRHPTSKEKRKTIQVTGPETIQLELEKADKADGDVPGAGSGSARPKGKGKGKAKAKGSGDQDSGGGDDDELMRPPWQK